MQYHLVIKASSNAEARQAAMDNGITDIVITSKHPDYDEVYALVEEVPVERLQRWYSNPLMSPATTYLEGMGPFPPGALLFFSFYPRTD